MIVWSQVDMVPVIEIKVSYYLSIINNLRFLYIIEGVGGGGGGGVRVITQNDHASRVRQSITFQLNREKKLTLPRKNKESIENKNTLHHELPSFLKKMKFEVKN